MSDHGHGDKPFLAHHFEDEDHQFDSGKLGIWAFLVTEVLFFSGLFCAYAIYRSMHPDVFQYAAQALDTKLGAINTSVLILSSLTAAWAGDGSVSRAAGFSQAHQAFQQGQGGSGRICGPGLARNLPAASRRGR